MPTLHAGSACRSSLDEPCVAFSLCSGDEFIVVASVLHETLFLIGLLCFIVAFRSQ